MRQRVGLHNIGNKRLLLIDCGQTVMTQLQENNLLTGISGIDVIITHMHGDHVGDELDCYGFSTKINGTHVVYTGDTKSLEPFVQYLHEGTQLFMDASVAGGVHLKLEDNLPLLKELTQKRRRYISYALG